MLGYYVWSIFGFEVVSKMVVSGLGIGLGLLVILIWGWDIFVVYRGSWV